MNVPDDRKYSETHEWYLVDGDIVIVGITQHAADELTDITFVDLPATDAVVSGDSPIGEVESVKATSEIFSCLGGQVIETNTKLADHPELINDDAFERGWLVKIKADSLEPLESLLDAKGYREFLAATV